MSTTLIQIIANFDYALDGIFHAVDVFSAFVCQCFQKGS